MFCYFNTINKGDFHLEFRQFSRNYFNQFIVPIVYYRILRIPMSKNTLLLSCKRLHNEKTFNGFYVFIPPQATLRPFEEFVFPDSLEHLQITKTKSFKNEFFNLSQRKTKIDVNSRYTQKHVVLTMFLQLS